MQLPSSNTMAAKLLTPADDSRATTATTTEEMVDVRVIDAD